MMESDLPNRASGDSNSKLATSSDSWLASWGVAGTVLVVVVAVVVVVGTLLSSSCCCHGLLMVLVASDWAPRCFLEGVDGGGSILRFPMTGALPDEDMGLEGGSSLPAAPAVPALWPKLKQTMSPKSRHWRRGSASTSSSGGIGPAHSHPRHPLDGRKG